MCEIFLTRIEVIFFISQNNFSLPTIGTRSCAHAWYRIMNKTIIQISLPFLYQSLEKYLCFVFWATYMSYFVLNRINLVFSWLPINMHSSFYKHEKSVHKHENDIYNINCLFFNFYRISKTSTKTVVLDLLKWRGNSPTTKMKSLMISMLPLVIYLSASLLWYIVVPKRYHAQYSL